MSYPFDPDWVVRTCDLLSEWLDDNCLTTRTVAVRASQGRGTPSHVKVTAMLDAVVNDGPVDATAASVLAVVTDVPPEFWLAFEHNYRTGLAAGKTVSR